MSASLEHQTDNLYLLRVSGELKKSDLTAAQSEYVEYLADAGPVRLLLLLEDFTGWERDAEWGDNEFFFSHGNDIEKIAIVGNARWESEMMAFVGAGIRKGPVRFFPEVNESEARAWLAG